MAPAIKCCWTRRTETGTSRRFLICDAEITSLPTSLLRAWGTTGLIFLFLAPPSTIFPARNEKFNFSAKNGDFVFAIKNDENVFLA